MALNQVSVVEDSFCQHSSILSSRNTQPEARKATKLGYLQNFSQLRSKNYRKPLGLFETLFPVNSDFPSLWIRLEIKTVYLTSY